MEYLNQYDFIFLFLGVVARFAAMLKTKVDEFGNAFDFRNYFDKRHAVRWTIHLFFSFLALLVFPQIFLDFIAPNIPWMTTAKSWSLFGSASVGFIGYDFIKLFEKSGVSILSKIGLKI